MLNSQQLQVELVLVCLLEEGNEESARLEDLRSENGVEESLIVVLALIELTRCKLLLSFRLRKGRDHHLRVHLKEVVAEDFEV